MVKVREPEFNSVKNNSERWKGNAAPGRLTGSGWAVRLSRIIALGGEGQRLSRADV